MRRIASVPLAVGLFVLYAVVWIGTAAILQPDGADFEDAFGDLTNTRYLVYALAVAVLLGAVVATVFGWWRDILADDRQAVGPVTGWQRHVPIIAVVLILATTDYPALADADGELLAWTIAGSILVGISEELMFRGNVVVALRRTPVSETQVWIISSVLFALIHVPNVVLGAPAFAAVSNTLLAVLGGTLFYVVRRATGTILAAMAVHAAWDFTLFTADNDAYSSARSVVYVVLVIAIVATRRHLFEETEPVSRSVESA